MIIKKALSFDDVMMVPKFSAIHSRNDVDLTTFVAGVELKIPIIAANMSSICESEMSKALADVGGLGIIHRMCSISSQQKMLKEISNKQVGFSIGIGNDWKERMDACKNDASVVALDVAHGHHLRVTQLLKEYFKLYGGYPIIIGQVATPQAVADLLYVIPIEYRNTVAFKASIGGGSLCTTRIKTGFGIPTFQSILDITAQHPWTCLISDGGIKSSGDIVKSIAAGANAVMLGNLLAGSDETPGKVIQGRDNKKYKIYRGSASFGDKVDRGEETRNIEGEETLVPYKGKVKKIISNLLEGIKSGFSYGGAKNISQLQIGTQFIEISSSGYAESLPHGK